MEPIIVHTACRKRCGRTQATRGPFIFDEVGGLVGFEGGAMQKNMASRGGSQKNMVCEGGVTKKKFPLSLVLAASVIMCQKAKNSYSEVLKKFSRGRMPPDPPTLLYTQR